MRGRSRLLAACIAAASILSSTASAQSSGERQPRLVFVGGDAFPPYQYLDSAGKPRGFNVNLMRALARQTGIDIEIRLVKAGMPRRLVESGEADLLCLGFSQERADRFTWLLPLWRLRQVALFTRAPGYEVRSPADLLGRRVLVGRGSLAWEEMSALPPERRPDLVEFADNDFGEGIERLRSGEAEVLLGNSLVMSQHSAYREFADRHETTYKSIPYYLAARKGREDLQPVFFAAFTRLQESGEFNAIVEQTLLRPTPARAVDRWAAYVLALLGVAAAALAGVATWNRTLRTQVDARTREFRAALTLHRATLDSTAEGIISVDRVGRITSYNQRFLDIWQVPAEVLAAGTIVQIAEWADQNVVQEGDALASCRRALAADGIDNAVLHFKDGRVIERYSLPQRLDGAIVGRVWSYRDVTERARAEEERRNLEIHIQQVQKLESLGVLAGGIAHDFNNLLVGMLGHASLALAELPPSASARDRIQQIETCAMRAAELTNQMLAYSGKARFVVQPTDLSTVVQEMATLLRTAISKNARLELQLVDSPPAVLADGTQLRQVVMNLITNASDAIGGRPGTIAITTGVVRATRGYLADAYLASSNEPGEYVYLEVRDDGCGMDAETRNRIFEPFFTTKFTGRGLGLAAVLGIVRGHRGAVHIESAPDRGTCFRVSFPSCAAAAVTAFAPPAQLQASRRGCILVVDDEPAVRTIAREALTRAGFTVLLAENGAAAVERFRAQAHDIDAVFLDMTMPGLSGVETLCAIRSLARGVPVVLTSGYSEQEAAARCHGETIAGFIQKPFSVSALVAKMNEALTPGVAQ
jgi:PAS domain S-box-containing protein